MPLRILARHKRVHKTRCLICGQEARRIFSKLFLQKYEVVFFQCSECALVFTERPYWLKEAYSSAISALDVGLVGRNLYLAPLISTFIDKSMPTARKFLDYAGGYGLFTRLMRDRGYDFYRQDQFCTNIFAQNFDLTDLERNDRNFDLVTAFEVFEHLVNPRKDVQEILAHADTIFFSTEIVPTLKNQIEDWWYLAPESGQHISFFSVKSLHRLAEILHVKYYTNQRNMHVFTRREEITDPFPYLERIQGNSGWHNFLKRVRLRLAKFPFVSAQKRSSLTQVDFNKALQVLRSQDR